MRDRRDAKGLRVGDPHLNTFYAYRGAADDSAVRDRQLEDNLTRALAVTLTAVRDTAAQATLLAAIRVPAARLDEPYQCRLQVREPDLSWPPPAQRRLLVLHGGSQCALTDELNGARSGRADAVIANSKFVLAIESKLGGRVSRAQLRRHCATLGIPDENVETLTWDRLARATRAARDTPRLAPVARFVLGQFEEYLAMTGFGGLTEEHLAFFARRPDDRDELVKEGLRRTLEGLMGALAESWGTTWRLKIGNIGRSDAGAWAKFEPDTPKAAPHLSVSIGPAGLDLFGNVETEIPHKQFRAALARDPGALIVVLRALGEPWPPRSPDEPPWRLNVIRRIQTGPRRHDYWPATDIAAAALSAWPDDRLRWFLDEATRKPAGESPPEIKIVRSYPASRILGDDDLPDRLAASAAGLEPFFAWLGVPVR